MSKEICIVGAPFCLGQRRGGVDKGPQILREAGLVSELESEGWSVIDTGDVAMSNTMKEEEEEENQQRSNWREIQAGAVAQACEALSMHVSRVADDDQSKFVLTLGGDHSIAIGSISGILRSRPDTRIIWVDAHADINTPETSESGNIHGMPVAYLMDMVKSKPFEWLTKPHASTMDADGSTKQPVKLLPNRIAYIGLRELDRGEKEIIKKYNIAAFSASDVERLGIHETIRRAVNAVDPEGTAPLHLSFDIDGLDPSVAASTGTPVQGGLTFREGRYVCE